MNTTPLQLDSITLAGHRYNGPIDVEVTGYLADGGIAIILVTREDGYPDLLSKVTVNLSQQGLQPDEDCVFVKDWSESEGMLKAMEEAGWMKATGRRVESGYVRVPEARLLGDLLTAVQDYVNEDQR